MQPDPFLKMLHKVAVLENRMAMSSRTGPVHEIKEGDDGQVKVRLVVGQQDGEPVLTPWTPVNEHRSGEGTQRKPFKKGQNMVLRSVDGDYRQAYASTGPEASHAKPPAQAKGNGLESWTQEVGGKAYTTIGKGGAFQEQFLAESASKSGEWKGGVGKSTTSQRSAGSEVGDATGGQQAEQQQQGGGSQEPKPAWKFVMGPDNEGMAMVNVKEKADCLVDDTMARIKFGKGCAFIEKGKPFVTEPWRIKGPKKDEHGRASKA